MYIYMKLDNVRNVMTWSTGTNFRILVGFYISDVRIADIFYQWEKFKFS